MAIALRSETTLASATRTNSTVTAPAGSTTGDLIVVHLECGGSTLVVPTQPGGWTLMESTSYTAPDPWAVSIQVWVKVWDGGSSWTFSHASRITQARVQAWTGVDNTTPLDVAASKAFQNQMIGGSGNATAPTITTVTNGARGIIFRGSWDGNAITPPAGWTERYDAPVIWVGDRDWPTAGATGAVVVSAGNGGSDSPWGIIMGALRPASSGTNYTSNPADNVGITDASTLARGEPAADPAGITDAASVVQANQRTANDPTGITDSATLTQGYVRTSDDPVGITDSATVTLGTAITDDDPVGITDSATVTQGFVETSDDPVGITDAASVEQDVERTASDPVGITDSASVARGFVVTANDGVGITDSASRITSQSITAGDGVGITDATSVSLSGAGEVSTEDPVGITDEVLVVLSRVVTVADFLGITDGASASVSTSPTPADPVGITDSTQVAQAKIIVISDPLGITDSVVVQINPEDEFCWPDEVILAPEYPTYTLSAEGPSLALEVDESC